MKEAIELLRAAERKIIDLYDGVAPGGKYGNEWGGNRFADQDEFVVRLREFLDENDKESYITIYESISGWTAVHIYWNVDGFWEPWNTGFGKYKTHEGAEKEAIDWAAAEGLRYVRPRDLQ